MINPWILIIMGKLDICSIIVLIRAQYDQPWSYWVDKISTQPSSVRRSGGLRFWRSQPWQPQIIVLQILRVPRPQAAICRSHLSLFWSELSGKGLMRNWLGSGTNTCSPRSLHPSQLWPIRYFHNRFKLQVRQNTHHGKLYGYSSATYIHKKVN